MNKKILLTFIATSSVLTLYSMDQRSNKPKAPKIPNNIRLTIVPRNQSLQNERNRRLQYQQNNTTQEILIINDGTIQPGPTNAIKRLRTDDASVEDLKPKTKKHCEESFSRNKNPYPSSIKIFSKNNTDVQHVPRQTERDENI